MTSEITSGIKMGKRNIVNLVKTPDICDGQQTISVRERNVIARFGQARTAPFQKRKYAKGAKR